jgi:mannose-6-phosphate isomerase-like protein (cupin superfamily)
MVGADQADGRFSLVEHPMAPRALGSPVHTHSREDEYSYVLEGEVGIKIGDRVLSARPGDLVFKPRGVPHAFWNATDEPARLLEIISPAGFERFFEEIAAVWPQDAEPDEETMGRLLEISERYGVEQDLESVPTLMAEHGLER